MQKSAGLAWSLIDRDLERAWVYSGLQERRKASKCLGCTGIYESFLWFWSSDMCEGFKEMSSETSAVQSLTAHMGRDASSSPHPISAETLPHIEPWTGDIRVQCVCDRVGAGKRGQDVLQAKEGWAGARPGQPRWPRCSLHWRVVRSFNPSWNGEMTAGESDLVCEEGKEGRLMCELTIRADT